MGDVGDYWREARDFRKARRDHWHTCPLCEDRFGTGTKIAPGQKCHHDGWQAPGTMGEDIAAARKEQARAADRALREEAGRQKHLRLRTCGVCGKRLGSEKARRMHEQDKHGVLRLQAEAVS